MGKNGGIYRPLTEDQVNTLHNAALDILKDTGIAYQTDQAALVEQLEGAGATIDRQKSRIKFDEDVVEKALAQAPEQVTLFSRDGKRDLVLGGDRVHFGTGGTTTTILDLESGKCRPSLLNDVFQVARLADQLKHVDIFVRPCTPMDVPEEDYDLNIAYAGLKGTVKNVMVGIFHDQRFADVVDMAAMVAGGLDALCAKPFISFYTSFSISPLQQSRKPTQILKEAVALKLPISISGVPMAGATGPVTLAGNLTLMHTEVVAGITMAQLLSPGAPVMYGGFGARADMQTANFLNGTIECGMMNAAAHQLARRIGVPNCSSCGFSESKLPDSQASWEIGMLVLCAAMGGSNLIRHAGGGVLESGMTLSLEQIIMNDEMIGMARRLLKGIAVDEEHVALDLIKEVGPGGTFLSTDHTFDHMRSEYFYGNGVTNRAIREDWENQGGKDARARAAKIAARLLSSPDPLYIDADMDREIHRKYPSIV